MLYIDPMGTCQIGLEVRTFIVSDATSQKNFVVLQEQCGKEVDELGYETGGERADPKAPWKKPYGSQ